MATGNGQAATGFFIPGITEEEGKMIVSVLADMREFLQEIKWKPNRELVKNREIAEFIGVEPNTVSKYKSEGRIPGVYKPGSAKGEKEKFVCYTKELEEWMLKGKSKEIAMQINARRMAKT